MKNNDFIKNIIIYGGVTGVSRMLPIILLPFYLSAISVDEFGRIEIIIALYNFFIILGSLQIETAVQRYIYKVDNKESYIITVLLLLLSLSLFFCFFGFLYSDEISVYFFGENIESFSIKIALISCVFYNLSTILLIYLRFCGKELIFCIATIFQVVLTSVITYILIVNMSLGSNGYFLGVFLGWLITFVLIFSYFIRVNKINNYRINSNYIKILFSFSLPQLPARFGSYFLQFGNRFFVLWYFGSQTVALLGLALKFSAFFQLSYIAFTMAWYPYLYKNESDSEFIFKIDKILKMVVFFVVVSSLSIYYVGGDIIIHYFNYKYLAVKNMILLAVLPFGMLIIKEVLETGIKLSGKTKYISYSYFNSLIVTFILMVLSVDIYDILLSSVIGSLVLILSTWYFSEKTHEIHFSKITLFLFVIFIIIVGFFSVNLNKG